MMDTQRGNSLFVHGNVVEIPESILQALEGGMEMLASLCCPLVLEQRGKEFYRIAQLLSLNAQLVPAASIEPRDCSSFLAHLPPASSQLFSGIIDDREVALVAHEIILRVGPMACL